MRMLRWMCVKTRRDKITNDNIGERVGVALAPIVEKVVETRLRLYVYVERRPLDYILGE
jgi:hypothetical protein